MKEKHREISYSYHFISEMILAFILLLPIMHFYYDWIPFYSYLFLVGFSCVLFSLLVKRTVKNIHFYCLFPILLLLFFIFDYPLFLGALFSVLFIRRYLHIRNELVTNKEIKYLLATVLVSFIMYLITREPVTLLYLLFQLIVLDFGSILSHIAVIEKGSKSLLNYKLVVYFIMLVSLGGFVSYGIVTHPFLFNLWDKIIYTTFSIVGRVLNVFQSIDEFEFQRGQQNLSLSNRAEDMEKSNVVFDTIAMFAGIYLFISVVLIMLGIVTVYFVLKKDDSPPDEFNAQLKNESNLVINGLNSNNSVKNRLKRFLKLKRHPVRKIVYDFEKAAKKNNYGRKQFETLEEWLPRIGIHKSFEAYQKIRYGNIDVSAEEVEDLRKELNLILRSYRL
ncbi:hypothetical protein [Ornithinibacillus contaminans]|uniref:hypothetical protein n=1 Tax=Ornithinibacillus contaminans TaxID=694055 RepID=UPI00064DFE3B|nr:hypothetical protein [Ornithinibacillus contaminans]